MEFPIDRQKTAADFLNAFLVWLQGSPHTEFSDDDLTELLRVEETVQRKGGEAIELRTVTSLVEESAGIRYSKREKSLQWTTTAIFSRKDNECWLGIRVECDSNHPSARIPPGKKPLLPKIILRELGGGLDGYLKVSNSPLNLDNADIDVAAGLISGKLDCYLPIVYVSSSFQGEYVIDPERMAIQLEGMAHVVVEPNRPFSVRLQEEVKSENVYGGAVGVYWPDGGGRRAFFSGPQFDSAGSIAHAILDEVRIALTNRRPLRRCTWAYLQQTASHRKLEQLRISGSDELKTYIETFDKEIRAKDDQLADAESEIARLRNELRILEARSPAGGSSLLRNGKEQDFYPEETYSIVREALEDACTRVPGDSRRLHILEGILEANAPSEGSRRLRIMLKKLLRGSRGMNKKIRSGLEEFGFSIRSDGKHYKLIFQGDDRYTFTLPKSGSDHRGGLNSASDIGRLLF